MTTTELEQYLLRLDLTAADAARFLGVTPRTMQRWLDGEEIPGPAEQALRAWIKLHDLGIPWKPDSRSIDDNDEKQISAHLRHAVDLAALSRRARKNRSKLLQAAQWRVFISQLHAARRGT